MGATITITGHPQHVRTAAHRQVALEIVTGPANPDFPPKGMPLFGRVTYTVLCSQRMWDKGHMDQEDRSLVTLEGYIEPRIADGKLIVAVVATTLTSKLVSVTRKAQELLALAVKAEQVYRALCSQYRPDAPVVLDAEAAMNKARETAERFCELNRDILRPDALSTPLEVEMALAA